MDDKEKLQRMIERMGKWMVMDGDRERGIDLCVEARKLLTETGWIG